MEKFNDILRLAQLIVRGSYINFGSKDNFINTSSIYRFTNEDITSYFHHLENKENILSVIGSGNQILNSILAGTKNIDSFDISVFPEYYLFLHIGCILSLTKEEYIEYFLSDDKDKLFNETYYYKIRDNLNGNYKTFWDRLYDFDDGIDIYNSLLFRQDFYNKNSVIEMNPYLQDNNYNKLKEILKKETIHINPKVMDITKTKINKPYDLINLSNILSYHFNYDTIKEFIEFLRNNFNLNSNGEIINYLFSLNEEGINEFLKYLKDDGYVEDIGNKKLLVLKNNK